jgi:hypothetical protein
VGDDEVSSKTPLPQDLPAEILDDERSWQGDHDPYLASLALEGRKHRPAPAAQAARLEGPADDGDPYLAQLARSRDTGADTP